MIRARILIAALVAGVAMFVGGCGGNDESTTTTTGASGASGTAGVAGAALSKDEFIKRADAICKSGDKALNKAFSAFQQGPPQGAELEALVNDTFVPTIGGELDAIDALPAPEGDADAVQAITDAARDGLTEIQNDPSQLADDNSTAFDEANKLASDYGLTVCGSN